MWANSRLLVILLSGIFAGSLSAQEAKAPEDAKKKADAKIEKQPDVPFEVPFWQSEKGVGTEAWVACMGQAPPAGGAWNPLGILGARVLCAHPRLALPDWQFVFEECLPIWHRYLERIRDGRPMPIVEAKQLTELSQPDWGMYLAWVQAVDLSHLATLDMFTRSAAENAHVDYKQLLKQSSRYRGQIMTVTGRINRVEKLEAARHRQSDIQFVYFTEIHGDFKGEPPYAALFTELPPNVPIRKKIDMEVTFHGYFLAHVLFAGDPKKKEKDVIAPYLVGKTLIVNRTTPLVENPESYSYNLIVWVSGGIVCVLILGVLLNFWFRRGDHRIEKHLADVRDKHRPFSLEPAEPPIADPIPPPAENGAPPATE